MVSCQSIVGKFIDQPSTNVLPSSDLRKSCSDDFGSAVVLVYRQFDRSNPYVSIRTDLFTQQMNFFKSQGYKVVTLDKVVRAVESKTYFGKKWIAITIDGAHRSFYTKAKPVLEQYKYPYTVFVSTEAIDQPSHQFMKWEELKEIAKSSLGDLGSHGHVQKYLLREMNEEQRKKDILSSVEKIYQILVVCHLIFLIHLGS